VEPSNPQRTRTPAPNLTSRLDRLHAAWAKLRTRPVEPCAHNAGKALFASIACNGTLHLYEGCATCQSPLSPGEWLPHDGVDLSTVPVAIDRRIQNPPCVVCGAWGTELHHWAPKEVFGDEADHWPTAWLCRRCHRYWHSRISRHTWKWVA
jgi:hypothetical protein